MAFTMWIIPTPHPHLSPKTPKSELQKALTYFLRVVESPLDAPLLTMGFQSKI